MSAPSNGRAKVPSGENIKFLFFAEVLFVFLQRKIVFKETRTGPNTEPDESNTRPPILALNIHINVIPHTPIFADFSKGVFY